jgi:hypothetical protein
MPKRMMPSGEFFSSSVKEREQTKSKHRLAKIIGGGAIALTGAGLLGGMASEVGAAQAHADVCYVIGGAADGSGEGARGVMQDQGRLNGCNEGVQTVGYTGDFWPSSGALTNRDAIVAPIDDLSNRLNNTPEWQHKVVFGFSEGSQVANGALHQTDGRNIDFDLIGNPNIRAGVFNSPGYNYVPLVKPIAELIGVADNYPQAAPRPDHDITVEAEYTKGDMFANAAPQGIDPFAWISGADVMVNHDAHRIPALDEPVVADFYDGNGVRNIVRDDGSPFTRTGENDQLVTAPNPVPEIPPFFFGVPPIPLAPPAPDVPPAPDFFAPPPVEELPPPPAPEFTDLVPEFAPAA